MKPLGDPITHFWLVQDMAKTAGVDLVAARRAGRLNDEDWAAMVTRCRGCRWTDGCQRWLAAHQDGAEAAPEPCENRRIFAGLAAQ